MGTVLSKHSSFYIGSIACRNQIDADSEDSFYYAEISVQQQQIEGDTKVIELVYDMITFRFFRVP